MKNQRILSAALAVLMAGSLAACGGCRRQHPRKRHDRHFFGCKRIAGRTRRRV